MFAFWQKLFNDLKLCRMSVFFGCWSSFLWKWKDVLAWSQIFQNSKKWTSQCFDLKTTFKYTHCTILEKTVHVMRSGRYFPKVLSFTKFCCFLEPKFVCFKSLHLNLYNSKGLKDFQFLPSDLWRVDKLCQNAFFSLSVARCYSKMRTFCVWIYHPCVFEPSLWERFDQSCF